MLLQDKVVVVAGVGPGLGQALARIAASEGASVVLAARNRAFLDETCKRIVDSGGRAIVAPCDVTNADQCAQLVNRTIAAYGTRIHGLVNCAFYHGDWALTENADPADIAISFDVNCLGALRMTQACLPHLKGGGAIVNLSTMATVRPYGQDAGMELGYALGKGGLNTLGKYLARDLGRFGIRVNTCRLGWMDGAPVQAHIQREVDRGRDREEVISEITRDIPIGQIPPEDDCARAVLMLVSDYSRVVSGASLDINGGHWMAP